MKKNYVLPMAKIFVMEKDIILLSTFDSFDNFGDDSDFI